MVELCREVGSRNDVVVELLPWARLARGFIPFIPYPGQVLRQTRRTSCFCVQRNACNAMQFHQKPPCSERDGMEVCCSTSLLSRSPPARLVSKNSEGIEDKTTNSAERFCCKELDIGIGVVWLHQACGMRLDPLENRWFLPRLPRVPDATSAGSRGDGWQAQDPFQPAPSGRRLLDPNGGFPVRVFFCSRSHVSSSQGLLSPPSPLRVLRLEVRVAVGSPSPLPSLRHSPAPIFQEPPWAPLQVREVTGSTVEMVKALEVPSGRLGGVGVNEGELRDRIVPSSFLPLHAAGAFGNFSERGALRESGLMSFFLAQ